MDESFGLEHLWKTMDEASNLIINNLFTSNDYMQKCIDSTNLITPWNNNKNTPTIKVLDLDYYEYDNEDIIIVTKKNTALIMDMPKKFNQSKVKIFAQTSEASILFPNAPNLFYNSINCKYTHNKKFFTIEEPFFHIISDNDQWMFIKLNFGGGGAARSPKPP